MNGGYFNHDRSRRAPVVVESTSHSESSAQLRQLIIPKPSSGLGEYHRHITVALVSDRPADCPDLSSSQVIVRVIDNGNGAPHKQKVTLPNGGTTVTATVTQKFLYYSRVYADTAFCLEQYIICDDELSLIGCDLSRDTSVPSNVPALRMARPKPPVPPFNHVSPSTDTSWSMSTSPAAHTPDQLICKQMGE
jgi:hypothetical protein